MFEKPRFGGAFCFSAPVPCGIMGQSTKQANLMKKLRSHTIGIDSGDVMLFSDYEDGGDMWTGRGQRERRRRINFSESYQQVPQVQVNVSLWDIDSSTVIRADISAETVTEKGFDMVFRTWGDTRVARLRVAWTAIGAVGGEDDWTVG